MEAAGMYSKGDSNQLVPWSDYAQVSRAFFLDAVRLITRAYEEKERMGFPNIKSEPTDRIFSDAANAARELAGKDAEAAQQKLAQVLHEFRVGDADTSAILAEMYVSSAKLAFRASSFHQAAESYKRAQLLNPKLNFQNKADALEKIQEGYDYAIKKKFEEAENSYKAAIQLDPTLPSVAPGIDKSAAELEQESKRNDVEKMKKLLNAANEEAIARHRQTALDLYNEAKKIAPDILKDLVPEEEYNKFAPKGPGPENAPPPVNPPNAPRQGG
jgi:tetratricopeptide (TPR) repeat protein